MPIARISPLIVAAIAGTAWAQAAPVSIDFDTNAAGEPLAAGVGFAGDEYLALGVLISTRETASPLNLFDTQKPTGGDPDLATGAAFGTPELGNVLILQDVGDNPISVPDDDEAGGVFRFDFLDPFGVTALSLGVLDLDEGVVPAFTAELADGSAAGVTPAGVTLVNPSFPGNNSLRIFDIVFDGPARALEVRLPRVSGAITGLTYVPAVPAPAVFTLFMGSASALGASRLRKDA